MSPRLLMPLEIDSILLDCKNAVKAKLYYPALLVALTVPDICKGLELSRADFVKQKHYVAFVDKYTSPHELGMNGIDCYRLRGGLVHKAGLARHPHFDGTHVIFTLPGTGFHVHALTIEADDKRAAMFDLAMFCSAMDAAARRWYSENRNNSMVSENLKHLIRFCPFGLRPFLDGAPVVGSGL